MKYFSVSNIAEITGGRLVGEGTAPVGEIVIDSRLVKKGDLFAALYVLLSLFAAWRRASAPTRAAFHAQHKKQSRSCGSVFYAFSGVLQLPC